ncbi:MAG: hypothetical protein E3J21_01070 [Anaerolineales bacterium]|nr:MAG: hypothetical protein E3J21_01070 [Anaerolineales bacterium]
MIHIYRATRYPDRDFFTFQATEDTIREFDLRFPVKVADTKKGFEGGYFVYLRDNYRETFFDLIKSYLRQNYEPPELRLSAFRAIAPLSNLWPSSIWQLKVTDAIKAAFTEQGYAVNEDEFSGSVEVVPQKASFNRENVQIYWGVSFKVQVPEDRYPLLWCQEQFRLFMDGKPASLGQVAKAHVEGSAIMQSIRRFTAHNAEKQFDFLKRFVNRIPPLASCDGITFEQEPVIPQRIGLETWFWMHDSEAYFETSNGLQTILAQAMLEEGSGFYFQPDDIQVIILLPIPDSSPAIPKVEWEQVIERAEGFLAQTLPDVELPVSTMKYPVDGDLNQTIQEVETLVHSGPDRRVLCLMATPGPEARSSTDPKLRDAEKQSRHLNKRLRDLFRGGYAVTVDWDKLQEMSDMPFIINNALMGGLYRLNAQPWKLCNLSFESESTEATYFLGLVSDVETTIVSGALFDYQGTLVAYGATHLNRQDPGKKDSADEIDKLIQSLLTDGIHRSRPRPTHVIVHVSPEMTTYAEDIQAALQALSIPNDVVSVDPKAGPRLWQPANQQGTPSHGIAVGSEAQKVAYLMNTLSLAERTNRGFIYPNPNTVTVRQLAGPTSTKALAAHVYWLSVAHINALHRTVDTPVTIAYAQALYDHVSKTSRPMRVTRNYKRTLYWL